MATVTKPIALDESINTTEQTPRNIADVLAQELAGIAGAITTAENVEGILSDMTTTKDAQVISCTAVFDTIDGNLVKALKVAITPSQAGSGTPSPSNIRPISGYTEEVISVKDSTDTTQETYTTAFGQTVYGGTLDVLTGELTITHAVADLGSLTWRYDSTNFRFSTNDLAGQYKFLGARLTPFLSSIYDTLYHNEPFDVNWNYVVYSGVASSVYIHNHDYTDATAFKTAMSGVQLYYELATPTTIQLTPQKVKTLVGENHISANTGDVLECKYSMMINGDDLAQIIGG
jgi:hypothetical protein